MKYLSIDLETTGLDPQLDQVLQLAAVIEDTTSSLPVEELPHLNLYIQHPRYSGNAFALGLNAHILDVISGREKSSIEVVLPADACSTLQRFICNQFGVWKPRSVTVAGKNAAGFDIPFLKQLAEDSGHDVFNMFRHRVIDPGSVCVDWTKDHLPSLEDLTNSVVTHDALEDARDVIRVLRRTYSRPQFPD